MQQSNLDCTFYFILSTHHLTILPVIYISILQSIRCFSRLSFEQAQAYVHSGLNVVADTNIRRNSIRFHFPILCYLSDLEILEKIVRFSTSKSVCDSSAQKCSPSFSPTPNEWATKLSTLFLYLYSSRNPIYFLSLYYGGPPSLPIWQVNNVF